MKRVLLVCLGLILLTSCGTKDDSNAKDDKNNESSSEVVSNKETKESNSSELFKEVQMPQLRTVENSIIDNEGIQIWYEVDVDQLSDTKSATVEQLYLIQNNKIAWMSTPGASGGITISEYNKENGKNVTEKEKLTLGEVAKLKDTDRLLEFIKENYYNFNYSNYDTPEEPMFYPLTYEMFTDGSGNAVQSIKLKFVDRVDKTRYLPFIGPMGSVPVYDGYFIGHWSKESNGEYQTQILTYTDDQESRFLNDEVNQNKFEVDPKK